MEPDQVVALFIKGKLAASKKLVHECIDDGEDVELILKKLIKAMELVGDQFAAGDIFLPEMMVSARCMQACLAILKPLLNKGQGSDGEIVVIGTVKGDLHDIGKNLVAMMFEGGGFEVIDIGVDVPAERFVQAALEHKARLVCLSSLLTSTMPYMRQVIDAFKASPIAAQVKIMVGGAPVNQDFASKIGADGFTLDAGTAVKKAKELLQMT
ncbi:MAG: corrinoid protein [Burkholderiaceae bacterium]|nr:corrinoid protein [Burkholderiaceae bacterium]